MCYSLFVGFLGLICVLTFLWAGGIILVKSFIRRGIMKTTLVIMAAGLGSRYGGDKQIDGIGPHGEMLMQYSVYDAVRAGFDKLVFIIKPEYRDLIERICEGFGGVSREYVYQDFSSIPEFYRIPEGRVKPFGTVHAVLCASDALKEPFAVINADDFYGADAFRVLHDRLTCIKNREASMVAYRLKNTVSSSGSVTRGICAVDGGVLSSVKETYGIITDETGAIFDADNVMLDGDAQVSMNMWGFGADIFDSLRESFNAFLAELSCDELKKEYALPTFVDQMIGKGELTVDVLSTDSVWFGVTYREDKESVREALERLHANGEYPDRLSI